MKHPVKSDEVPNVGIILFLFHLGLTKNVRVETRKSRISTRTL